MRPVQARLVTACQQVLALGVVLAVITPAASVLSLDIVGGPSRPGGARAPLSGALSSATVPSEVVEANVTEVALTTSSGSARALAGDTVVRGSVMTDRVASRPQPVSGYTAVGVTWAGSEVVEEDEIAFQIRTREGDGGYNPAPQSNLVGAAYPDLVVRRASDGRGAGRPGWRVRRDHRADGGR